MKEEDKLTRGDKVSVIILAALLVVGLVSGILFL